MVSLWGRDFPRPFIPALGPTQPPTQWYRAIPGGKAAGVRVDHPPSSSAEVKERAELYLCSPSVPSWQVIDLSLLLYIMHHSLCSDTFYKTL